MMMEMSSIKILWFHKFGSTNGGLQHHSGIKLYCPKSLITNHGLPPFGCLEQTWVKICVEDMILRLTSTHLLAKGWLIPVSLNSLEAYNMITCDSEVLDMTNKC